MKYFEKEAQASIEEAMGRAGIAKEQFEFFWETKSPFSQWHKSVFVAKPLFTFESPESELNFSSAEQFMMVHKALFFKDTETAKKIMLTQNVREQKLLGRKVSNFDTEQWDSMKVMVVYEGNKHKFQQNPSLQQALIATAGKTLVEAAPDDNVWGIGLTSNDPRALERETWLGTNFLGIVLTALRMELAGTY